MKITSTMQEVIAEVYMNLRCPSTDTLARNVASVSQIDRAIVLGENGDFPREVVERFALTHFFSPYTENLEKEIGALPSNLQSRCKLTQLDPSGLLAPFSEMVEKIAGEAKTFTEFSAQIKANMYALPQGTFAVHEKTNFVASFMICGYYDLLILPYLNRVCLSVYGMPWEPTPLTHKEHEPLLARYYAYRLSRAHLHKIAQVTNNEALLHVQKYNFSVMGVYFTESLPGPIIGTGLMSSSNRPDLGPSFSIEYQPIERSYKDGTLLSPSGTVLANYQSIYCDTGIYTIRHAPQAPLTTPFLSTLLRRVTKLIR